MDSQTDPNNIQKSYLSLEVNTVTMFYCLDEILLLLLLLTEVVYLMTDTFYFFIIPMCK